MTSTVLAIGLAARGATFFGLASVRQHRAVRASVPAGRTTLQAGPRSGTAGA